MTNNRLKVIATVTQEKFDSLLEYSSSIPTGVIIGKQWKCRLNDGSWILCEYVDIGSKDEVGIKRTPIEIES